MKQLLSYFLLFLLTSSCSRSMYYAYEDDQSYCTIEAIPKRKMWWLFGGRFDQVIYRAASKEHYDTTQVVDKSIRFSEMQNKKRDNIYIYKTVIFFTIYRKG